VKPSPFKVAWVLFKIVHLVDCGQRMELPQIARSFAGSVRRSRMSATSDSKGRSRLKSRPGLGELTSPDRVITPLRRSTSPNHLCA
jgi:hypothetical protein